MASGSICLAYFEFFPSLEPAKSCIRVYWFVFVAENATEFISIHKVLLL